MLAVSIGIVAANLLVPVGKVLVHIGPLIVTEFALLDGIGKALTFEGLIHISKASILPGIRLPGRFGSIVARAFIYYDKIVEYRGTIRASTLVADADELMLRVSEDEAIDAPPIARGAYSRWGGFLLARRRPWPTPFSSSLDSGGDTVKLRTKLIALTLVPLVTALALGSLLLWQQSRDHTQTGSTLANLDYLRAASSFIGAIQMERETANLVLTGGIDPNQFDAQVGKTDAAEKDWHVALKTSRLPEETVKAVSQAVESYKAFRTDIKGKSADSASAFAAYTTMVDKLLDSCEIAVSTSVSSATHRLFGLVISGGSQGANGAPPRSPFGDRLREQVHRRRERSRPDDPLRLHFGAA